MSPIQSKHENKTHAWCCAETMALAMMMVVMVTSLVAGTWSETHEICHGVFFVKLAHDNVKV